MNAAVVVKAEPPDSEVSIELQAEFLAEMAERYPNFDTTLIPSATPAEMSPPGGTWCVAYVGRAPVGCGGLKRLDESTGEVKRVYVRRHVRGQGVAGSLMAALEDGARSLGYRRVRLDTGIRQPEALAVYLRLGYTEIAAYNANPFASHWLDKAL